MKHLVAVTAFNGLSYNKVAVKSILDSTNPTSVDILLMSDASTDGTTEFFKSLEGGRISTYTHPRNMGLTALWNGACTVGAFKNYDTLTIINNDVICPPGWHEPMVSCVHPGVAVISPTTNRPGHQPAQDVRRAISDYRESDKYPDICEVQKRFDSMTQPSRELPYVNGFCIMHPREAIDKLRFSRSDWYDPRNRNVGNEDEFQERAHKIGMKSVHAVGSFVFHYKDVTLGRGASSYRGGR